MAVLGDSLFYDLLITVVLVLVSLYYYFTAKFDYWKDRGVAFVKPIPVFGNLKDQLLRTKTLGQVYSDIYGNLKGNRFGGFFELREPVLMVLDPNLVETVLIKDFRHFYNRPVLMDPKNDPLTANLFNLEGTVWKNLRNKLTPTFTTGKLKTMTEQIFDSADKLIEHIADESKQDKNVDSKSVTSSFTLEVIASVAFGLQIDKNSEVGKNFRELVEGLLKPSITQTFKILLILYASRLANLLKIKQFPKRLQDAIVFIVRDSLDYRKKNNVKRNDFIQQLLNVRQQELEGNLKLNLEHEEDDLIDQMKYVPKEEEAETSEDKIFMTDMHITAQALTFLLAGLETVSSTINFALFTLAENPDVQAKLHEEIDHVMKNHKNTWSYQAVKEMVYLEEILQESMRMYPQIPGIFRICTEDYQIPDSDVVIKKGTRVIIPVGAIMNDPNNYDSPEVFDPSRFQDNFFKPNGKFLPFGDGPRVCIAMRFVILEMKVCLAKIMAEFEVKTSDKMKTPLVFEGASFGPTPVGGFWFQFEKRK
uniref:Cytochrome P450 n=1 Tax=Clastoptera arizonana TaxID=38151 RepID=A0A1B6EAW4_9HEMI